MVAAEGGGRGSAQCGEPQRVKQRRELDCGDACRRTSKGPVKVPRWWKASWVVETGSFHGAPTEAILACSDFGCGRQAAAGITRATGRQRFDWSLAQRGRKRPRLPGSSEPKRVERREARRPTRGAELAPAQSDGHTIMGCSSLKCGLQKSAGRIFGCPCSSP